MAQGLAAADKEQGAKLKATRCFCIEVEDSKQSKWIFARNGMPELKQAFTTVRENGCLAAIQVTCGEDFAPRSRAAKDMEKLIFRQGSAAKRGQQQKKARK